MSLNVDLLRKVQAVIRAEPRRLDMRGWLFPYPEHVPFLRNSLPPCGTVACIGGWGRIITTGASIKALDFDYALSDYVLLFVSSHDPDAALWEDVESLLVGYPSEEREGEGVWAGEARADAPAACRVLDRLIAKWAPETASPEPAASKDDTNLNGDS